MQEVKLLPQKHASATAIDYEFINKSLKFLLHTFDWFSTVVVQKVDLEEFEVSFSYKENSKGFLKVDSPSLALRSSITNEQDILKLSIEKLEEKTKKISVDGALYLDLKSERLYAKFNTLINNDANLTLYSTLNAKKTRFVAESQKDIEDIKAIIALARLPEDIKFWTYDAINTKNLKIESLKGEIDFTNLAEAYKNIYVKAKANKLAYTYNTALDGIHAAFTDLEFKDGVLYIRPKDAYSYKSELGKSWLKIDFTQKEELLTLHLLFDGMLNNEMLEILNAYKIKLPFLQKSGFIKNDLTLVINLSTLDVDAQGIFQIEKGNFDYLGLNLDIADAKVFLNNYDVRIPSMQASYKDVANANVKVIYDAKNSQGKIDFLFDSIRIGEIRLDTKTAKQGASYNISPLGDSIQVAKSFWNFKEHNVSVGALETPFDLETLKVTLPTTHVALEGVSTAFVSGEFDIKTSHSQLLIDVLTLSYKGINFSRSNTPFSISYTDKLSIKSPKNLFFNITGTEYLLEKPIILADAEEIVLKNSKLTVGKYATTKIYVKHDLNSSQTHVSLSDLNVTDAKKEESLFSKKKVLLSIKNDNDMLVVNSDELGTTFTSNEEGWELYVNSLSGLVSDSEFLQKFNIDTGEFTLYKERDQHNVGFSASIIYPYKLLTQDDTPTNTYAIEGEIKNDALSFVVNKNTSVFIDDAITIDMKKTGININEVINAVGELQSDEESNESITLKLNAVDSYLYISESRKALADLIELQYANKILSAQLFYKQGKANLKLQDKKFHLQGKDFDDAFMRQLFAPSKFKGGSLEFFVGGTTDEYSGVLYASDTTILSYKLLNNILAFINTVPSLVTFSLPGYSSKGLNVEEGYINFQAKNKLYTLSDIYLKSQELSIVGKGNADFKNNTIDARLNLQTDLGSDASQIPLVGYILFDKESVSTTINLKGDLKDPTIESLLAQDIAIAPLNIIKRTLSLPYDLFKNIRGDANSSR